MSTKNYRPGELTLVINGVPIQGKVGVTFTYPNNLTTTTFDIEGEATHSTNVNANYANVDIELTQANASNLIMTTQIKIDAAFSLGFIDNSGNSIHTLPEARFMKYPDAAYEQEAGTRVWQVEGYDTVAVFGGN